MFGLNPQPQLFLLLVLLLGPFSCSVQSLRFELQPGNFKCISEDIIKSKSMTVGNYSITNPQQDQHLPDSHNITVMVSSHDGRKMHHHAENVQSGQFAFEVVETGTYVACFWATDTKSQTTFTVDFDWKTGVEATGWSKIIKKGQVDVMTLELRHMNEVVSTIHDEMFYLRKQGEEMEEHNRKTNTRMFWLSLLSLFICMSVAGLQLWHLKTFFEKKKII